MPKTSSPDGSELDVAVARAEMARGAADVKLSDVGMPMIAIGEGAWEPFRPSINWCHAGAIIEREGISVGYASRGRWLAYLVESGGNVVEQYEGATALVAAMRAYVASRE